MSISALATAGTFARRAAILVLCASSLGCEKAKPPELVSSAKFGVFFGGQIEERREIPFELDAAKQTQGFRVDFTDRLADDVDVAWTIELPGAKTPAKAPRKNARQEELHRRTITGKGTAHAGEKSFEQITPFEPGDPLGLWNARVVVRGRVVIDRPFEVFDKNERARATAGDAGRP